MSVDDVMVQLNADERFSQAIDGLVRDGLVTILGERLHLTK